MSFDSMPSDNLYMKGLPAGTTEDTLRAIFGVYGSVVSCKVLSSPAGVTDTAALVRMSSIPEAQYLVDNAVNIAGGLGSPVQIKFANNGKGSGKGGPATGMMPMVPGMVAGGKQVSTRLYMKGLPLGMGEDQVRTIIGAYGNILSLKVLSPPPGGASDSACIVQMASEAEAQWLVENLDGNIPQGLTTPVNIKYKQDGPPGMGGVAPNNPVPAMYQDNFQAQDNFYAQDNVYAQDPNRGTAPSDNLYMRGLPPGTNEQTVMAIFGVYGTVTSVKILPPPAGKSDVASLVRFATIDEAQWLVDNLNGNIPQGLSEPINVRFADNIKGSGKGKDGMPGGPVTGFEWSPSAPRPAGMPMPQAMPGAPMDASFGQPTANLYMKGLPIDITETTLNQIFIKYGQVLSVKVLMSPPGVDNAAALVQMGSVQEAEWLVNNVNNNIPEGLASPILIKYANNTKGTSKGAFAGDAAAFAVAPIAAAAPAFNPAACGMPPQFAAVPSGATPAGQPSDNLYMKGFSGEVDEDQLRAILGPYGNILSIKVLPPPVGKTCAAALVRMSTLEEAKWLVENMNGNIPQGQTQPVEVKYAANSGAAGGKGGGAPAQGRWAPY